MALYKGSDPVAGLAKNTIVTGFNIFDVKWSDHLLNDIQWLRADTFSWQSGDVYVTAYNKLVEEYATGTTETEGSITFKRSTNGFKIADATQEQAILNKYNSDGIAWYYILDTTNKRFKLPRTKFGFEGLRDNVGNDIAESLPNIKGGLWARSSISYSTGIGITSSGCINLESKTSAGADTATLSTTTATKADRFTIDASRSSSTYQDNAPVQERGTQMYLYFYVGEYSREAIEQTAGITTEQLNNKVDIDSSWGFPSNRYIDLTLGASGSTYTAPANGYIIFGKVSGSATAFIELLTNNPRVSCSAVRANNTTGTLFAMIPVKKGQSFNANYNATGDTSVFRFIYAEGSN